MAETQMDAELRDGKVTKGTDPATSEGELLRFKYAMGERHNDAA
jgi:hypothetical protein